MASTRKIRVLVQTGIHDGYSTRQFVERDVSVEVREDEDMAKALRFLMSDEFKAVEKRLEQFSEARPLIAQPEAQEQELIG